MAGKKLTISQALAEVEDDKWQCETCTAPAMEDGPHCLSCKLYWADVEAGLFNEPWEPFALQETPDA